MIRERRALVAQRAALVRSRTGQRNRANAVVARALARPPVGELFRAAGRAWLADLALPTVERLALDTALRLHDAIEAELSAVERAIATAVVDDPEVRHLLSVPGIGLATAASLVAVIGDVTRFRRPAKLVAYLGLDPRVRQSGIRPAVTGHISRAARPMPGGCSSRPPMPRSGHRVRSTPSTSASGGGAARASRSSPSPAS